MEAFRFGWYSDSLTPSASQGLRVKESLSRSSAFEFAASMGLTRVKIPALQKRKGGQPKFKRHTHMSLGLGDMAQVSARLTLHLRWHILRDKSFHPQRFVREVPNET